MHIDVLVQYNGALNKQTNFEEHCKPLLAVPIQQQRCRTTPEPIAMESYIQTGKQAGRQKKMTHALGSPMSPSDTSSFCTCGMQLHFCTTTGTLQQAHLVLRVRPPNATVRTAAENAIS